MNYMDVFKMPKATTIMARTSSITNSFVNGIVPCIQPTEDEIKRVLKILGMDKDNVKCSYCGDKCTEWDHFRPLVREKRPTGYISEINNLVPVCGKCNQSKGNKYWKDWILSDAQLSPKSRGVPNLDVLIKRLETFETLAKPVVIDIKHIIGEELWKKHWDNCAKLHNQMRECQEVSEKIKGRLTASLREQKYTELAISLMEKTTQEIGRATIDDCTNQKTEEITSAKKACTHTHDGVDYLKQKKVGIIVQNDFKKLLESNTVPRYVIEKLQDCIYCKSVFDINFAVLLKIGSGASISRLRKDHLGRDRYYASPITINGERYLLTSQWYDRNKQKLIAFIANYCSEL